MIDYDALAFTRIYVNEHIQGRVRERLGWSGRPEEIRVAIRLDIAAGRVNSVKPNWTCGEWNIGQEERPPSALYVWNRDATYCWVLTPSGGNAFIAVTVLIDRADHMEAKASALLRTGMVRRA